MYIKKVDYIKDYILNIEFKDGKIKSVDFKSFIFGKNTNPLFNKYKNIEEFKNFNVKHGTLLWNDYEMCFEQDKLYKGKV